LTALITCHNSAVGAIRWIAQYLNEQLSLTFYNSILLIINFWFYLYWQSLTFILLLLRSGDSSRNYGTGMTILIYLKKEYSEGTLVSRIKLQMPETFLFSTTIDVRITDLNYGNHLANDSLLSIIHESRVRFLKHMGYSELDIEGTSIIMADVVIIYKSQSYYGDVLNIEVGVGDILKKSCEFFYRVTKGDDKVVAFCKTAIVFFDYQIQKPAHIPEPFLKKLNLPRNHTENHGT
jgi:acyl-CoA thioesterase FadM